LLVEAAGGLVLVVVAFHDLAGFREVAEDAHHELAEVFVVLGLVLGVSRIGITVGLGHSTELFLNNKKYLFYVLFLCRYGWGI
jgi:hypothetical protein